MQGGGESSVIVRQDARVSVIVALYVRQALGLHGDYDLPPLREAPDAGLTHASGAERATLEAQFTAYWAVTVEPLSHRTDSALDLVPGFGDAAVLPVRGADELRAAMAPLGTAALDYANAAHERYRLSPTGRPGIAERAYASAVAQYERRIGRRAHRFELNVEVLPLVQRGLWWIGDLTVAVTDSLRGDVVAFDDALAPVLARVA